jgi:hypothetical protein
VPLYVCQLVLLKVQPSSPAYVIISYVNNYVSIICAVFATGEPTQSGLLASRALIDIASLEHGHLTYSVICTPLRAQLVTVYKLRRANPWLSGALDRLRYRGLPGADLWF